MMRFLNYGSLNMDYVYRVDHINQAGETLTARNFQIYPGGKGANQSVALARAGGEVWHAGKIGGNGRWLLDVLTKARVHTDLIAVEQELTTGHAIIQVADSGENCIIVYPGANHSLSATEITKNIARQFDVLLLQNEVNNLPELVRSGLDTGSAIVLNPSPYEPALRDLPLERLHTLLLNETEAMALAGRQGVAEAMRELSQRFPSVRVVLTLGGEGVCASYGGKQLRQQALKVKVVDTTAAGDTFTGFYSAAFFLPELYPRLDGEDALACAIRVACVAAARSVGTIGAIPSIPTREELLPLSPAQTR